MGSVKGIPAKSLQRPADHGPPTADADHESRGAATKSVCQVQAALSMY